MFQAGSGCSLLLPVLNSTSTSLVASPSPSLVLRPSLISNSIRRSLIDHNIQPINLPSSDCGVTSLAASDQPMSGSVTGSGPRSGISTRASTANTPVVEPEPTSMSSSDSSPVAPPSNTRDNDAVTTTNPPPGPPPPSPSPPSTTPSSTRAAAPTTSTRNTPRPSNGPAPPTQITTRQLPTTVVSVVPVLQSNPSTVFTTVTSSAESTFSTPVSVSVTNPVNGIVSLTAPPFVTVRSTSTEPNGAFVTFTHIVANPVDLNSSHSSFLNNHGLVAGVFAAIGVVATVLVLGLIWFIRRQRRIQRRKAWFASLRQHPPTPFQDAHDGPFMQSVQTQSEVIQDPRTISYSDNGYRPQSPEEVTGLGLTGTGTAAGTIIPGPRPLSGGDPFRDPQYNPQPQVYRSNSIGLVLSHDKFNGTSQASVAQSSPSIYPESLPPTDELPKPIEPEAKPPPKQQSETLLRRSLSVGHVDAPPRPPRSHLRESVSKVMMDYVPLTPPASLSSSGHSKPPSPGTEHHHMGSLEQLTTRRTLLNVRPRTAPEGTASQAPF